MIKIKRAYEQPDPGDGFRVLIDRLCPRGVSKAQARIDLWLKEISPSTELRKWFNHDPHKWNEFKKKYLQELQNNPVAVEKMHTILAEHRPVTLVYAAKDELHNDAVVLSEYLNK